MDDNLRFDERIMAEVEKAANHLIKNKELRSVSIVLDWELPPAANASLPVGAWRMRDGDDIAITTTGMQAQLPKMGLHLTRALMEVHQSIVAAGTKPEQEEGEAS